ncbi:MAG TPA: sigma-70 family RNA polymerase sigma factor [Candidatus Limnocylindrales bacterium]|nr:sigma-70 family RNA polymerase sigma factor [Candidatus Limnocylindrales bacterium]
MTDDRASTDDRAWLAQQFEAQRGRLRAVAYRMLGSMAEADDAVQDAWLRVSRADSSDVENLGGWLTTIVARLCLDRLRSRAARPEESLEVHVPDPVVTSADDDTGNPEREAELADSIGLAMLVVLERLSPPERLAFVLHDTFGLRFDDIGRILDRSPVAARQLASRARRRVRGEISGEGRLEAGVPRSRQRELAEAFLAAARDGDFEALVRVLDPAIVVRADTGTAGGRLGPSREIRGAAAVARSSMAFRNLAPGVRRAVVNGALGFVVWSEGRPYAVIGLSYGLNGITEIDILADPERLASLELSAAR